MPQVSRVVAVVVAYNRRELLMEALAALAAQSRTLDAIVVVDNASDDGSGDAVRASFPAVDLVTLERNTGGAGGFAAGMAHALEAHDPTWLWLMDDDTIPTPSAAAELVAAVEAQPEVTIAGSRVIWTDGQDHPMNTPREKPFVSAAEKSAAQAASTLAVRSSSFVSMFVSAAAVRQWGLPVADYFIWNDDFEFSTRLLRSSRGIFVPASVVVHKTKLLGSTDLDPGERFFFEVRNKVWLMRYSRGLKAWEKAMYGASSIRRWIRTIRRSQQRPVLWAGLRRGLAEGGRTRPVSNTDYFADLPAVANAVARVEAARE
ncbi:glycosyltransferase [Salinibacterium sp. UTAS2018]|uniref:glycosyltransferase n=1 Tax=Salinibacterium sp. UTAS2018 TaxID=2508880 RepID=UPI0010095C3E|nr:glycosyltransferase [Salinibacterium sp. UTAS2018]QAV69995.1 glycosyltransferase [Salinibacterium sp. UTAS2018]